MKAIVKYITLAFFLFFPLSNTLAFSLSSSSGTTLSGVTIVGGNNDYRYYLTYEDPASPISSFPPTSNNICGYIKAQVEGGPTATGYDIYNIWDANTSHAVDCTGHNAVGTWQVLETNTGGHNVTVEFTLTGEEEEPTTTTATSTTATTTIALLGSINFGLGIIIIMLFLVFIFWIAGSINPKKKAWQHF